jgi:hypothetical protein
MAELNIDDWLAYFRNQVKLLEAERDFLERQGIPNHARLEQLMSGPKEAFLENARELLLARMHYQLLFDGKLRLCRIQAEECKEKTPEDARCEELRDLCRQIHIISTQILPPYYREDEFLERVLLPEEYEGLRRDVINDTLLAGKKARGEV